MTTAIILDDKTFPIHVPLYDYPSQENCGVFAVFGGTRAESVVNHAGRAAGQIVGNVTIEPLGMRCMGAENYIRFTDIGPLSPAGLTMVAVFKSPPTNIICGLVSLWGVSEKNSDASRRRLYVYKVDDGMGPQIVNSYPTAGGGDVGRTLAVNSPCIVSVARNGNGVASRLRIHNADGSIASTFTIGTTGTPLTYTANTVFEVGNGLRESGGNALISVAALWSGVMSEENIVLAAKTAASASGLF